MLWSRKRKVKWNVGRDLKRICYVRTEIKGICYVIGDLKVIYYVGEEEK